MRSPGTLSMREDTFRAVLEDVARSLKMHGFKNIIFIGDSGGNQAGQRAVAEKLNAEWSANPIVAHVQEYYDYDGVARHMEGQGIKDGKSDNLHDDPIITLNMFIDDPKSVRYDERVKAARRQHQRRRHLGSQEVDRAGEEDRRVPRAAHGRRHQQGDRQQGHAAGASAPRPWGTPGAAAAPGGGQAPARTATGTRRRDRAGSRSAHDGRRRLRRESLQLLRHAESAARRQHRVDRRDDVDGRPRRAQGGQDHGDHLDRRHRAQRPVARARQAQLRAARHVRRDREEAGNALCAPIIQLVPEGRVEPPSGHMRSPGTISMREETFQAVLTDVAHSLKMHGFQNIIFIGDSGGNQSGQKTVAEKLNAQWNAAPMVAHIGEYYTAPPGTPNVLRQLGRHQGRACRATACTTARDHAQHDADRPEVGALGRAREGRQGDDQRRVDRRQEQVARMGAKVVDARAERTVVLIKKAIASKGKVTTEHCSSCRLSCRPSAAGYRLRARRHCRARSRRRTLRPSAREL